MEIDIWSDIVCPWCYIGKRRFEQAVSDISGEVTVRFRSFQLDPSPVVTPLPLVDALAGKFGGAARARQMFDHVARVAAADGITMNFDRAVAANTFDAHRLIGWAATQDRQADMVEALYRAHFTDGVDLGSPDALADVAAGTGLERSTARTFLTGTTGADTVRRDLAQARELGVTSVPTFVLGGRYAVQGAQDAATLRAALEEASRIIDAPR